MPIHVHPLVVQLRFYDEGVDVSKPLHAMRDQYRGGANVTIDDAGVAQVTLLTCDDFLKADFDAVRQFLKSIRVKTMRYTHKGIQHEYRIEDCLNEFV